MRPVLPEQVGIPGVPKVAVDVSMWSRNKESYRGLQSDGVQRTYRQTV